jgi:hypothetical protein
MGDLPLWVMLVAFGVWELYAHFVAGNKASHTLSNRIWALQGRYPWTRWLTWAVLVVLALHLPLQLI